MVDHEMDTALSRVGWRFTGVRKDSATGQEIWSASSPDGYVSARSSTELIAQVYNVIRLVKSKAPPVPPQEFAEGTNVGLSPADPLDDTFDDEDDEGADILTIEPRKSKPRKDVTGELLRCNASGCGALVWKRPAELRSHLEDHFSPKTVEKLTTDQIANCYRNPRDPQED